MSVIYRDLIADPARTRQVIADVAAALARGRNCLVLTNWTAHLQKLAGALRDMGHDPVVLRGGMGARDRAAALARLQPGAGSPTATKPNSTSPRWPSHKRSLRRHHPCHVATSPIPLETAGGFGKMRI